MIIATDCRTHPARAHQSADRGSVFLAHVSRAQTQHLAVAGAGVVIRWASSCSSGECWRCLVSHMCITTARRRHLHLCAAQVHHEAAMPAGGVRGSDQGQLHGACGCMLVAHTVQQLPWLRAPTPQALAAPTHATRPPVVAATCPFPRHRLRPIRGCSLVYCQLPLVFGGWSVGVDDGHACCCGLRARDTCPNRTTKATRPSLVRRRNDWLRKT